MSNRPAWDDQFAETEDERNARLATKRAAASGMFRDHSCWKCLDDKKSFADGVSANDKER